MKNGGQMVSLFIKYSFCMYVFDFSTYKFLTENCDAEEFHRDKVYCSHIS